MGRGQRTTLLLAAVAAGLALLVHVGVARANPSPTAAAVPATSVPATTAPATTVPPTTVPPTTVPPTTAPAAPAVALRCGVDAAAQAAVAAATDAGERSAVAVLDTATGTYTAAGDSTAMYSTASVVKVFLATQLLLTGQMTGDTADAALEMITQSDDDDADALYGLAGGDDVITTLAAHYGIADLGAPPADFGQWGETMVTAAGLAHFYAAVAADPVVWPWLSAAMAGATATASDGTNQLFGIPSAAQSWSVKQGWMTGLGPGSTYNSTGYVDGNRYVVVLLSYGSVSQYGQHMEAAMTAMATALMPDGVAPGASC